MLRSLGWAFILAVVSVPAIAADWPQFRGPNGNGVTGEGQLPLEWGAEKNVAWKIKIPGKGWSSPIVWGDKMFVTTAVTDEAAKPEGPRENRQAGNRPAGRNREQNAKNRPKRGEGNAGNRRQRRRRRGGFGRGRKPPDQVFRWEVYCLDCSTGKVLWNKVAHEGKPSKATHRSNTYASETPATDGERVYAYFSEAGLFCYDLEGELIWKQDVGTYRMQAGWGTSSSPVVHDDLVFLQVDNEEKSFVVAYDTKTGDERWRDSRKERSNWSSPIIWKNAEQTELIAGGRTVRSYDPASGKVLWELAMGGGRSSASPVADENRLYVGTEKRNRGGYDDGGGTLFAVKVGATGDVTPSEGESTSEGVVWSRPNVGLSMASPLVYENFVYVLGRRSGMVSCYAAETGEPAFENKRLPGARAFWASPWAYGGKVFCLDDTGTTHVIEPGAELSVVAKNTIGDQFWASSAIAGGSLLLRGVDSLYCIKQ